MITAMWVLYVMCCAQVRNVNAKSFQPTTSLSIQLSMSPTLQVSSFDLQIRSRNCLDKAQESVCWACRNNRPQKWDKWKSKAMKRIPFKQVLATQPVSSGDDSDNEVIGKGFQSRPHLHVPKHAQHTEAGGDPQPKREAQESMPEPWSQLRSANQLGGVSIVANSSSLADLIPRGMYRSTCNIPRKRRKTGNDTARASHGLRRSTVCRTAAILPVSSSPFALTD